VSFGYRYDYDCRAVVEAAPPPSFLEPLRREVVALFDRPAESFPRSSSTNIGRARGSAGIGTRRNSTTSSACGSFIPVLRFRRKAGETWNRASLTVEPRSAYLLSGPARTVWEHSIPALDRLRYSVTLRTLVAPPGS
jgi:hypothetical protein